MNKGERKRDARAADGKCALMIPERRKQRVAKWGMRNGKKRLG
jgi:hypothetical protein